MSASFYEIICFCRLQASVAKKAKNILEDHSKRPGQSHLERLNAKGKHYIFYLAIVLEFCYFEFLLRKKMLLHELFFLIQNLC